MAGSWRLPACAACALTIWLVSFRYVWCFFRFPVCTSWFGWFCAASCLRLLCYCFWLVSRRFVLILWWLGWFRAASCFCSDIGSNETFVLVQRHSVPFWLKSWSPALSLELELVLHRRTVVPLPFLIPKPLVFASIFMFRGMSWWIIHFAGFCGVAQW